MSALPVSEADATGKERFGILLVGGTGSRLFPITQTVNKHLVPVYSKPQIYYSLSILMRGGHRDIAIVSTPETTPVLEASLGDGQNWGLSLRYVVQPEPKGIAEAILLCGSMIENRPTTLMLGDNLFLPDEMEPHIATAMARKEGATVFAIPVPDPERFGIVTLDDTGRAAELVEKPPRPTSNLAVTGLYFYDKRAYAFASRLTPSARGELEITDLNRLYLEEEALYVEILERDLTWMDCGNPDALLSASQKIQTVEQTGGTMISCPEEIALKMGYIDRDRFARLLEPMPKTQYRNYLETLLT